MTEAVAESGDCCDPAKQNREGSWLTVSEIASRSKTSGEMPSKGRRTPMVYWPPSARPERLPRSQGSKETSIPHSRLASRSGKSRYNRTIARSSEYINGSLAVQARCSEASSLRNTMALSL